MSRWLEGMIVAAILLGATYLFVAFVNLEWNPLIWSGWDRAGWILATVWLYWKAMSRAE